MKLGEDIDEDTFENEQGVNLHDGDRSRQQITMEGNRSERKKYGKNLVLFDGKCLVTLGPDYWCFLPTFTIFCVVSFFMIKFVFQYSQNVYFRLATVIICGGMPLSYLLVAISNPGIVTEQDLADSQQEENPMAQQAIGRKKLCRACNMRVRRGTYHCSDCDVCVREYDHHCPWTSKCIGGGNLIRFYVFLGCVPVYLVYVFVAFATLMSAIALDSATAHLQTAINQRHT